MCAPTANSVAGAMRVDRLAGKDAGEEAEQRRDRPSPRARVGRPPWRFRPPRCAAGRERECRKRARNRRPPAPPSARRSAPTAGARIFSVHCGKLGLSSTACRIIHSETKPLSGGRAEIAAAPTSMKSPVAGMRLRSPPSRSSRRSPVAVRTAPAPKNRRLLNSAWLKACSSAAVIASAAAASKAAGVESVGEAEADEDEADVLDRAVGEHALEVVVHQRLQHADEPAARADDQHRDR